MTSHERDLILKVADEIRAADRSSIELEAERLIRAEVAPLPHAAYLLTQRTIVQGLALQQAQMQIDELENRLRQAGKANTGSGGSFLGSTGSAPPTVSAPPTGSPTSGPGGSGIGTFLTTAAAAAAGTIGAGLIFDSLRHLSANRGSSIEWPGTEAGRRPEDSDRGPSFLPEEPARDWGGGGDFGDDDSSAHDEGGGGDFGADDHAEESNDSDEESAEDEEFIETDGDEVEQDDAEDDQEGEG